ncbi:MAG: hypothetical protein ACMG57_05515 [Candidatus Dojkabacteria bacterium]
MNKLYRFSPIKDEKTFKEALSYITTQLESLSKELFQEALPINTVKIFPHYLDEYDYLYKLVKDLGPKASFSSDTSYYAEVDQMVGGYNIKYIGVRIVDPYRLQVGCGDYEIENFKEFREKHSNESKFVRDFRGEDMIEIWHPDYDVLGYIVPPL